jgi:hypothetical protein
MANTYKLLSSNVLTGTQTTITFSSIPAGYTDLVLSISARTNSGSVADAIKYTLNNDSSAVYTFKVGYGNGTSAVATGETNYTVAGRYFYANVGNGSTANTFGNGELYISRYASQQRKAISENGVNENNATAANLNMGATVWAQNQAVNSIELQSWNGADFVAGSSFYLYGVWNGTSTTLPSTPTIGTATAGVGTVSVAFTATSATGVDASYTALSSPGSITATGTSSPITVSGLTGGTAYTFQVRANNPGGSSTYSSASNSATPLSAAFESIATAFGSGSSGTITFNSIPGTYTHLQIRGIGNDSVGNDIRLRFNSDTGSNYSSHYLVGNGTTTAAGASASSTSIAFGGRCSNLANSYAGNIIEIHNYALTTMNKTTRTHAGYETNDTSNTGYVALTSGLWNSTAAITSISLILPSGSFDTSTQFALYGIKS